ncbi:MULTISPECIES: conserved virulence factor C family protein [Heyndrickxia]|uniref:conserved virulence factor C family protein n=1 Tax=Heyndrickxia TaxID=2837504 RepID=UPI002DB9497F|nr:conserved virulence factor C family protein [Weizmannia sp. CD-2023]MEC2223174.1 conserved virulence factor C family protein [Weizmannia sp. CD-2023]MED4891656.1 conserved virulence factor C family protein [Weizmannia sp. CD-2023]
MKIKAIEPTPSPNTMKVVLTEALPDGARSNYKKGQEEGVPPVIRRILDIEGVKGVYHVADFLAVERHGKTDWQDILPKVREVFGEAETETGNSPRANEHFGEVQVFVQMFKGIPLQVKLTDGEQEKRFGLPDYFAEALAAAQLEGDNYVFLRKWKDFGVRYGEMQEIGAEVTEEIIAAYPKERLNRLVNEAQHPEQVPAAKKRLKLTPGMLETDDWRKRYRLLEQMEDPDLSDLPVLEKALEDEKPSIRRLAVVYSGMVKDKRVLPLLYRGLHDANASVRRTAGDCLSDLGFKEACGEMAKALKDKSKIVRWRAAMFLYEAGDEASLPALREAENDPEFEVRLQVRMAIERITKGEEAKGSVWKQMTEARQIQL